MDISVYVSSLQDRTFLALAGLAGALFFDIARGAVLGHRSDPRPVLERIADTFLFPLASRLNRPGRSDGALISRGVMVLVIGVVIFFAAEAGLLRLAHQHGQGGAAMALLVAASVSPLGWFAPLRALARIIGNPSAPRPYMILARATYSNLITLDDSGMIRVTVTGAIRSLVSRLGAPLILYVLFGWQVLAVYWPVMTLALSTGQDGTSRAFAALTNALAALLLLIPTLVMFPIVFVALFFSAGASFFRAIPGFFMIHKWPRLLQGGPVLQLAAYAMKLTLGGPRQDRSGAAVLTPWAGPSSASARLEPRDIGRVLYLQGVTLLLTATLLFVVAVIS
jgi:hypothetical protein